MVPLGDNVRSGETCFEVDNAGTNHFSARIIGHVVEIQYIWADCLNKLRDFNHLG